MILRILYRFCLLNAFVFSIVWSNISFSATLSAIQSGTVTIGSNSSSITETINAVDLTKSFLVFSVIGDEDRPGRAQVGGRITSSTLLTFDRFETFGTNELSIYWQVFEFSSGVFVQRGTTTDLAAGGKNVKISPINVSNSFATVNMRKDGSQYGADDFVTANIAATSTLQLFRETGGNNPQSVHWQVIEWTGANVQKVQQTLAAGSDLLTVNLGTAVDRDKSMVISSFSTTSNLNMDDFACTELTSDNEVTFSRVGVTGALGFVAYVVEFTDDTDVIHGSIRMTASQNNISTTICEVAPTLSGIIPPSNYFSAGANCEITNDDIGSGYANISLTSSTTVNAVRNKTGFAAVFPFQVLDFSSTAPTGCVATQPGASTPRTSALCGVTLPIELLNLNAIRVNENVEVKWKTASEINNDYFIVERSKDGVTFERLDLVEGAGNSTEIRNYSTIDENPYFGLSYYRLKQVDFDGSYAYSKVVSVLFSLADNEWVIYPNPTAGYISIRGAEKVIQSLEFYNAMGQKLPVEFIRNENGVSVDLSSYPNGVYFFKTNSAFKKVIKH